MRAILRPIALILLAFGVSSCSPATTDTSCLAFGIIPYHGMADSPDTIQRIREHNAAFRRLCGK